MTLTTEVLRPAKDRPVRLDSGSFRDPAGGVVRYGDRILRYYNRSAADGFRQIASGGHLRDLESAGMIVRSQVIEPATDPELHAAVAEAVGSQVALIIEHPRLPFVSYAYEWPFEMLRDAALHQLDTLDAALQRGFILKDATSYNSQFPGPAPVFIDVASLEPYVDGAPWAGYAQFCRMFLNPLLLQALRGVSYHPWLRHSPDGLDAATLTRLLSFSNKLRPTVFVHVVLQAMLNRRFSSSATIQRAAKQHIRKEATVGLVRGLRGAIAKLRRPKNSMSVWIDYEANLPYAAEARAEKERFVEQAVAGLRPRVVWDLGCNRGLYTAIAARHAGHVVAMDFDEPTIGALYEEVRTKHRNVLPLVVDLTNPSPDQGWAQSERMGLATRGPADFALALALVHHLSIGANVPLPKVVDWLASVTRAGVIEFVPKGDPMVERLLSTRPDVFPDYTEAAFQRLLTGKFAIEERRALPGSERVLYRFGPR